MYSAQITVPTDVLDAIRETAQRSPKLMQTAYERATRRLRKQILDSLREEPGRPHYPLRWKSDKQRRYVMAMLRESGNLPYDRTGALLKAWDVRLEDDGDGGIMVVENTADSARYVVGDDAQPYHLDTGWIQGADVVSEFRPIAEDVLIETWYTIADPFAGVPR